MVWPNGNRPMPGNAIQRTSPACSATLDGLSTLGGGAPNNDGRYVEGVTPGAVGQTP